MQSTAWRDKAHEAGQVQRGPEPFFFPPTLGKLFIKKVFIFFLRKILKLCLRFGVSLFLFPFFLKQKERESNTHLRGCTFLQKKSMGRREAWQTASCHSTMLGERRGRRLTLFTTFPLVTIKEELKGDK